jgi:polysaccharide export outer membrane protein
MKLITPLLFLLLCLTSCASNPYGFEIHGPDEFVIDSYKIKEGKFSILEMEGIFVDDLPADALDEYKDLIFDDDILRITLYHPTRSDIVSYVNSISGTLGYRVSDGMINLPDLPPIEITNLTLEQARQKIENKFLEEIQDVEVFLGFKERLIRKVDFMGLVALPALPVNGKLRLYDALAIVKIPSNANLFMSYVIRDNKPLRVDMTKLIKEGDLSQNIILKGGDKVYIANSEDSKVMLMGEIGSPRALAVPSGYISLREAIVSSGGIPYTGDKRYIQVIRGNLMKPKIYTLNWNIIVNLPNDSLLLMPGDTVYVSAKPITEWNRFISQITPSYGGLHGTLGAYKAVGLH